MTDDDVTIETDSVLPPLDDLSGCRVQVVGVAPPIRRQLARLLAALGIRAIDFADDGDAAWQQLLGKGVDLVLIDQAQGAGNGYCRRLRLDGKSRRLPVLMVLEHDRPADRSAAFRAGATDLVVLPILGPEVVARVRSHLENRLLIRDLEAALGQIGQDLDLARRMQLDLLPTREDLDGVEAETGLRVQVHFQPSAQIGGDFWALHRLSGGRTGISLVDFAGHGVTAALNTFRLHAVMSESPPDGLDPAGYLSLLNDRLVDLLPPGQFATMSFLVIDGRQGVLSFAGAGATSPIVANPGPGVLDCSGLPLGIKKDVVYQTGRIPFSQEAALLLYSDAVTESPDRQGRCLGTADLEVWVERCRSRHGFAGIVADFLAVRQPLADDLTLLHVCRGGVGCRDDRA